MQINFYKNKKSLLKLLLVLTLISYIFFYTPQNNIISGDTSYNNDELSNVYFPNTSDGEITISTPENKTYTEPMEGYYLGTIGFEHEKDGTTGTDIDFVDIDYSGSNCVPRIISGLDGHEKVLQMDDDSASEQVDIRSLFDNTQEYGTIELYWKSTDASKICYFDVRSGDAAKIRISIWQNKFQYWDGTYHDIVGAVSDTWYRLRIDFESGSGGYEGLSADTYFIYINEVKYGPYNFESSVDYLDDIRITTHDAGTGYDNYFDAIGYSWDSNYNSGDNLNEGLLLSYDNSTNLDWQGYSLDGQTNKTILGNTTITMPNIGSHTIQVFGDSLGTDYSSDIRYFSVGTLSPIITISTPENKTYTEPDSGYYPGSFGFEDSLPGTIPDGWYTRSSGDGYYEIDHLLEDHYNVYEIRKSGGTSKVETYKILPQSATIGTIEFWLYKDTDSSTDPTRITLRDEPTGGYIPFGIENEDLFIGKWDEKIYTFNNVFSKNEWHHIRVDFDLSVGWQLKLDDTWYGAGYTFTVYASDHPPPSKINTFHVESIYSGDNPSYGAWFDAISYSWDNNYNSGDNLNEGLLLSYTNTTDLDWIGYSLDGSPNITITGNKVIPFPEDGVHSIIINGITSNGVLIKSESRDFAVLFQEPHILPVNPYIIPIVLASIGIGIIALLSIAIFLFRRRIPSRTSSTIISHRKPQLYENADPGSDQFKVCPLCHTQIKITDQFCVNCGTSLKND